MKKEIVFCIPQLYGGGAEQQIKYLANIFTNDFRVKIIVLNNYKTEGIDPNIKIIKIKKLSFKSLGSILTLRNELKNNYVISASIYFDILCGLILICLPKPLVCNIFQGNFLFINKYNPEDMASKITKPKFSEFDGNIKTSYLESIP